MKTCTKCQRRLPLEAFWYKSKKAGKRHSRCGDCMRPYTQAHYQKNKAYYVGKNRQPRSKQVMWNLFSIMANRSDLFASSRSTIYKLDWDSLKREFEHSS